MSATLFRWALKILSFRMLHQVPSLWVYGDPKGEKEEMELEFSHVHLLRRPATVIRAVKGATV